MLVSNFSYIPLNSLTIKKVHGKGYSFRDNIFNFRITEIVFSVSLIGCVIRNGLKANPKECYLFLFLFLINSIKMIWGWECHFFLTVQIWWHEKRLQNTWYFRMKFTDKTLLNMCIIHVLVHLQSIRLTVCIDLSLNHLWLNILVSHNSWRFINNTRH